MLTEDNGAEHSRAPVLSFRKAISRQDLPANTQEETRSNRSSKSNELDVPRFETASNITVLCRATQSVMQAMEGSWDDHAYSEQSHNRRTNLQLP